MRLTIPQPTDEQILRAELARQEAEEKRVERMQAKARAKRAKPNPLSEAEDALRKANKLLDATDLLARLKNDLPEVHSLASVYGRWVWLEFPMKPHESVMHKLKVLGFSWSPKRQAWYHPCGAFSIHSKTDPRFKYQAVPAQVFETEPQPIFLDVPELSKRLVVA